MINITLIGLQKIKRMKNILKLMVIAFLLSSCSTQTTQFADKTGQTFNNNEVYKQVIGINDSTLNYAIYFPKNFDGKTPLPVLILLDPHAEGDLPVNKYAELANKYKYILVGSNVSRNGMSVNEFNKHFTSLLKEIKTRYAVNTKRMFAGGFSGGAKMAILCAEQFSDIVGVVACGASLSKPISTKPNYYFAGIIGDKDFNYLEMRQSFSMFDQYGFDYTATVFDGKHQWAPAQAFETAFVGFDIYSAKTGNNKLTDEWIENVRKRIHDSILMYNEQQRKIDEYEMLQQEKRWFYGLKTIANVQKQIANIVQTADFNHEIQRRRQAIKHEIKLRAEFVRAVEIHDAQWWKKEIEKIKKHTKNKEIDLVKERLLNYVSMVSYMLIKANIENNELEKAEKKLEIYKIIDPQNHYMYLMYAQFYLIKNNTELMLQNFKQAQQKGLKSVKEYENDPFWKKLFSNKEIKKLIN